jgi:DNA-binding transcriptional MerR regulator
MFKIGEFAKIAQVSGRLLRYYNEIGLFTPEQIDPASGYRFYSAAQLPRLNRILALRDLGLTLDQIGRMLDGDISADEIRGMLFMRKAQIEQNLQEEIERLNQVELRLKQIEQEGHPWTADVVLKEVPALPILACSFRDIENQVMWSVISAVMNRALPTPPKNLPASAYLSSSSKTSPSPTKPAAWTSATFSTTPGLNHYP